MGQDNVLLKKENRIATITINRPDVRNAMGIDERKLLIELARDAGEDSDIRAVIITGAGKAFCSGGDVKTMPERAKKSQVERKRELLKEGAVIIHQLRTMEKPVIAMVNGAAVGMGLSLALGCDIRIASDTARFGAVFSRIGMSTDFGCAYLLTHLAGTARAMELLLTGDIIDAGEAEKIGLVNKVVPHDELEKTTYNLAQKLVKGPPIAYGFIKSLIYKSENMDLLTYLDVEATAQAICSQTKDAMEGVWAFIEKREAEFKGE